jgi:hypothetical protein
VVKISDIIAARETTEREKAAALDAVVQASRVATDKSAADDAQKAREARGLRLVGPTVIGTALYSSPDGVEVHKSTVNLGDADVPDDEPTPGPGPGPEPAPSDGGAVGPLTPAETAAP